VKKTSAEPTADNLSESYSVLDKAAKSGALHKKTAARMKSSLSRRSAAEKPTTED
jgi:ribosomal protein S20